MTLFFLKNYINLIFLKNIFVQNNMCHFKQELQEKMINLDQPTNL